MEKNDYAKILAIALVLALSFVLIEKPNIESGVPLHSDSYDNIAAVQQVLKQGTIFIGDPFAPSSEKSQFHSGKKNFDLETGYVFILTFFSIIPGIDPLDLPIFFPWISSLLLFFTTFLLTKKLCRDEFSAFFASLCVFLIPSTQQMLGPLFLVASSLGLALLPLLIYSGIEYFSEKKFQKIAPVFFIISFFIYPPAVAVGVFVLLIFLAFNITLIEKNKRKWPFIAIVGIAAWIMYTLFLASSFGIDAFGNLLKDFFGTVFFGTFFGIDFVAFKTNALSQTPFLDSYLGLPLFILCALSVLYFFWKQIYSKPQNGELNLIFASAIIFSAIAFLGVQFGRGFFIPTERMVMFASYFLLLSFGFFLAEITIILKLFFIRKNFFSEKHSNFFFSFLVLILCAAIILSEPADIGGLERNFSQEEFDGINWINENTSENDLIFAAPYISKPIRVFTGRNIACTSTTRFGCSPEQNLLVSSTFFASCLDKQKILTEIFKADYFFVQKKLELQSETILFPKQNCSFLKQVFEGNNVIVYKIERTN